MNVTFRGVLESIEMSAFGLGAILKASSGTGKSMVSCHTLRLEIIMYDNTVRFEFRACVVCVCLFECVIET